MAHIKSLPGTPTEDQLAGKVGPMADSLVLKAGKISAEFVDVVTADFQLLGYFTCNFSQI